MMTFKNEFAAPPSPDEVDSEIIRKVPYAFARRFGALPFSRQGETLQTLVRVKGASASALSEYRRSFGVPIEAMLVSAQDYDEAIEAIYARHADSATEAVYKVGIMDEGEDLNQALAGIDDILAADDDAPIIRMINALLTQALREHASDLHFEVFETRASVRFRIDGRLQRAFSPPPETYAAITSRLKVMANMDIAEKRLPQDGRFSLRLGRRPVDVRISTIPSSRGERIVLRLLDKREERLNFDSLGLDGDTLSSFTSLIQKPHGIILVTGPTGSGKTTTLYAALQHIDRETLNIMTVEDPIEYELEGISQSQVHSAIDMTFARALRSILRQDPDVIMIGEIRDPETARIAVQASLTGHLVLSTLHTNDAIGAVARLIDMGVEPYLLASSLLGVMAQRLIRTLCPECKKEATPDQKERHFLGDVNQVYHPVGCATCRGTGYQGRIGLFELVVSDSNFSDLIHAEASENDMRQAALAGKITVPLSQRAYRLARKGVTSLEEVLRVVEEAG